MGSGKSTVAFALSALLGRMAIDLDRVEFDRRFRSRRKRYAECDHRVDSDRPVLEVAEEIATLCGG